MVYFDCFKSAVAIFHSDSAPIAAATAVVISAKDSSDIQQQQNGGGNRAAANQGVHNSRPAVVDFYDNQAQSSLAPLQQQMEGSGFTEALISNLGAGAIAGTVGTTITIPLEVVKTRMQSSQNLEQYRQPGRRGWMPWLILKSLWRSGGIRDCYKGLVPNLLGVTPANSIYFATYSSTKRLLNNCICRNDVDPAHDFPRSSRERANNAGGGQELFGWRPTRDSPLVHMCSAGVGALTAATFMNPIWVIRTRLQLHDGRLGFLECRRRIWRREGIRGFFRGVSGSYLGVFETMIQFSVYEWLRSIICDPDRKFLWFFETDKEHKAFYQFMIAGAMAKTCAVCVAYPHEVIRTRLREEGNTLNLRQTIMQVCRHDGFKGFYRGLDAQLLRSVPNTAIIMLTYELVVTGLKHLH